MFISVNYKSERKQQADEIRCPYNQLGLLLKFIQENPDKRYIIQLHGTLEEVDITKAIEQIGYVKDIADRYSVECNRLETFRYVKDEGFNTFLNFPVTDWETFQELRGLGVSDIRIDGPLGFQVDRLKRCAGDNIWVRAVPNVSVNILTGKAGAANFFFIRPEDLYLYEDAIDVIYFQASIQEQEDSYFDIYYRSFFQFTLDKLVPQLVTAPFNPMIEKEFAEMRLNCGQRCKTPGYACNYCNHQFLMVSTMTQYFKSTDKVEDNKNILYNRNEENEEVKN